MADMCVFIYIEDTSIAWIVLMYSYEAVYITNPFVPSVLKLVRLTKISILFLEGILKKISYERRDY